MRNELLFIAFCVGSGLAPLLAPPRMSFAQMQTSAFGLGLFFIFLAGSALVGILLQHEADGLRFYQLAAYWVVRAMAAWTGFYLVLSFLEAATKALGLPY